MLNKKFSSYKEKLKSSRQHFWIFASFVVLNFLVFFVILHLLNSNSTKYLYNIEQIITDINDNDNRINYIAEQYLKDLGKVHEDAYNQRITQAKIDEEVSRVEAFFTTYNGGSILQGYGRIIVEQAHACGGDYKILVGIAGNESGLGRVPYMLYNPYGYLDGVQYESWEHALTHLSCLISQEFIAPCNKDLGCIIQKYGGPETNHEMWIRNVRWFMDQV